LRRGFARRNGSFLGFGLGGLLAGCLLGRLFADGLLGGLFCGGCLFRRSFGSRLGSGFRGFFLGGFQDSSSG
jgi:hypothetical protein